MSQVCAAGLGCVVVQVATLRTLDIAVHVDTIMYSTHDLSSMACLEQNRILFVCCVVPTLNEDLSESAVSGFVFVDN